MAATAAKPKGKRAAPLHELHAKIREAGGGRFEALVLASGPGSSG